MSHHDFHGFGGILVAFLVAEICGSDGEILPERTLSDKVKPLSVGSAERRSRLQAIMQRRMPSRASPALALNQA